MESIHVDVKTSDAKTPAIDYSVRKGKAQKDFAPEDPESDPDSSDSSSSYSDSSDDGDYKSKRLDKNKKYWKRKKRDPIKLCAELTEKLMITAYKSKVIKSKLGEDPLQRRIYFHTCMESLEMIFSQYK